MSPLVWTLLGWGLLAPPESEKITSLRYLRPEKGRFVLESAVTAQATPKGVLYVSRTVHAGETMTLTIQSADSGQVQTAEAVLEKFVLGKGKERKKATLDLTGATALLKRGGTTDLFKAPANPVVTTAPDWSDIFTLVRRYNAARGGKQEFAGLWIHPTKPLLHLTFTIERAGGDKVRVKDKPVELTRYQVRLRSGDYLVWARPDGVVCKLIAKESKAAPVVLEGYEEATRPLGAMK